MCAQYWFVSKWRFHIGFRDSWEEWQEFTCAKKGGPFHLEFIIQVLRILFLQIVLFFLL